MTNTRSSALPMDCWAGFCGKRSLEKIWNRLHWLNGLLSLPAQALFWQQHIVMPRNHARLLHLQYHYILPFTEPAALHEPDTLRVGL